MHCRLREGLTEGRQEYSGSVRSDWEEQRLLLEYRRGSYGCSVTLELINSEA